jgi:hypothetical protein
MADEVNLQWKATRTRLEASDRTRLLWGRPLLVGSTKRIECWRVGASVVVFLIYKRGFDAYTSHQSPGEIDKILPWLLEQDAMEGRK